MKRITLLALALTTYLTGFATCTPFTVNMSSDNATAFTTDGLLGTDGAITYYTHWDNTYLYLGWTGGRTNYSSDMYYASIDLNPHADDGGAFNPIDGVTFETTEQDFYVVYENNASFYGIPVTNGNAFEIYDGSGGNWNFVSRTIGNDGVSSWVNFSDGPGEVRLRVAWSTLGFTPGVGNDIAITMWANNSSGNFAFSSFPQENPTGPTIISLTHEVYFGTTGAGTCPAVEATSGTLPVMFKDFSGYYKDERVQLEWISSLEQNNDFFEIQRMEHDDWVTIGKQQGQTNSIYDTYYTFTDYQPASGNVQYRLKQVDLDGKYSYSDVLLVFVDRSEDIKVYPNPVRDQIHVQSKENEKFQIVDTFGKVVMQLSDAADLDMSHLPEGIYFVVLFDEHDVIKSQTKVVKL